MAQALTDEQRQQVARRAAELVRAFGIDLLEAEERAAIELGLSDGDVIIAD